MVLGQPPKQRGRALQALGRTRGHDLRQLEQLRHGLALGDPLGAEGDLDLDAEGGDHLLHQGGHPGEDRGPQHEHLAVAQVRGAAGQGPRYSGLVRVQVLVDRRADHHDHVLRRADHGRVGRGAEPAGGHGALEKRRGARLIERQLARVHGLDGRLADVIDGHPGASVGERDRQRQSHMTAASDHYQVALELAA
jgi:hypothetical protein